MSFPKRAAAGSNLSGHGGATFLVIAAVSALTSGCLAPSSYRHLADRVSYDAIADAQRDALGEVEPFSIEKPSNTLRRRLLLEQDLPRSSPLSLGIGELEPIKQWNDEGYIEGEESDDTAGHFSAENVVQPSLLDALQIAARESRDYQSMKERVFEAGLQLDLQRDSFRNTWTSALQSFFSWNLNQEIEIDDRGNTALQTITGVENGGSVGFSRRLTNGLSFTGLVGLDLVSLLTQEKAFSRGVFADVTISIPLLRGSGKFIVREPLTQAERDVVYAIYDFERFKREFAVEIASAYLAVLGRLDSVENAEENYRSLIASTRRARRLADAGRLPEIQVDQSQQDELRARNQWIAAVETYERQLDTFKLTLGLPVDSEMELDPGELESLATGLAQLAAASDDIAPSGEALDADAPVILPEQGQGTAGKYELKETDAIIIALDNRLDLRTAIGRVLDTQRTVAVSADQLRADLTLLGSGSTGARRTLGAAGLANTNLRPDESPYSALLTLDLPLERTAERNIYRNSLIRLEQAVRDVQALEDRIKLDIRNGLRRLLEARESIQIQASSVQLAERRVASTNLFLEAGRAEIRDLLEAQEALVTAQNALTSALVSYRVNELSLQRDLGVIEIDHQGLWKEYTP